MSLEHLTFSELEKALSFLRYQQAEGSINISPSFVSHPFKIGANYLIRTVTMIDTGRLVEVTPTEIVLEDAAWVADTGRFSDALRSCVFGEVEPFPDGRVIVGRGALIDAVEIAAPPRKQK